MVCCSLVAKLRPTLLQPHGLQSTRLLHPRDFPGNNTGVGFHFLLQGIFLTQGSNPNLLHCRWILYHCATREAHSSGESEVAQSCLLFGTPWTIAYQAPLSMGFSRQEYWSGLPFPSPEDLPHLGIKPRSPTLQADSLPTEL